MSAVTRRALKAQTDPQEPAVSLAQETSDEVTVGEINVHVAVTPGEHATTVRFQLVDPAGKPLTDLSSRLIFRNPVSTDCGVSFSTTGLFSMYHSQSNMAKKCRSGKLDACRSETGSCLNKHHQPGSVAIVVDRSAIQRSIAERSTTINSAQIHKETNIGNLHKLAVFIGQQRDVILVRWRQQVRVLPSARQLDIPTLNDHIPDLLDELVVALQSASDQTIPVTNCEGSPPAHGRQRVQDAFNIEEVVAEYNILRGCIHDLADENDFILQGKPFRIINRVFDHAIGLALQSYATQQALEVQHRREEYLAFVTHDLRTPLNAISLAARVLELTFQKSGITEGTSQMLSALRRNVNHLEAMVGKILEENSNLQTEIGVKLERREFDLWPLVENLIHDLHPVAGTASTQLINRVPDALVVYADAGLLKRVFQNLIANAIRYTPRGIVVIEATESGNNDFVECRVNDNGAGIPEELLEKVFDKGQVDPESEGGMGLGLAIVKTFTEAHGGQVTVESKQGLGTTFRFSLPTKARSSNLSKR